MKSTGMIKIVGVPSGSDRDRLARQEFQGLFLPAFVLPSGQYAVPLEEAFPIIELERPLLASWLERGYQRDDRGSFCLLFEQDVAEFSRVQLKVLLPS